MAKTHALVIGISQYKWLPRRTEEDNKARKTFGLLQLESPAIGAYHFSKWLKEKYYNPDAPLGNCQILLSLSDLEFNSLTEEERQSIRRTVKRPTTLRVRKYLFDWYQRCKEDEQNVAVLYVAGHGMRQSDTVNYVLMQDFAQDPLIFDYALHVERVYHGLKGPTVASKQFYFVDACRTSAGLQMEEYYGDGLGLPRVAMENYVEKRVAPIYQSTAGNDVAKGDPGLGTIFSQSLLACLEGRSTESPYVAGTGDVKIISLDSLRTALEAEARLLCREHGLAGTWISVEGTSRSETFHYERPPVLPASEAVGLPMMALVEELLPRVYRACEVLGIDKANAHDPQLIERAFAKTLNELAEKDDGEKRAAVHEARDDLTQWSSLRSAKPELAMPTVDETAKTIEDGGIRKGRENLSVPKDEDPDRSDVLTITLEGKSYAVHLEQKQSFLGLRGIRNWWLWSVWVKAEQEFLMRVKSVSYELHPTFKQAQPKSENRETAFAIERVGWGEFNVCASIELLNGETHEINHYLRLYLPDGSRCID